MGALRYVCQSGVCGGIVQRGEGLTPPRLSLNLHRGEM